MLRCKSVWPLRLASSNLILSLFLLEATGKWEELPNPLDLLLNSSSTALLLWSWNKAYVVFVRAPSLLDILHGYFLHGAPWHDVPFFPPQLQRKIKIPFGFYERSNPVEKVCKANVLCHPRRSDSWLRWMQQMSFSVKLSTSSFLSSIQRLTRQKLTVGAFPPSSCASSRWRLQPNSQPIPARPALSPGTSCSKVQPSSLSKPKAPDHSSDGSIHALKVASPSGWEHLQLYNDIKSQITHVYRAERAKIIWIHTELHWDSIQSRCHSQVLLAEYNY